MEGGRNWNTCKYMITFSDIVLQANLQQCSKFIDNVQGMTPQLGQFSALDLE